MGIALNDQGIVVGNQWYNFAKIRANERKQRWFKQNKGTNPGITNHTSKHNPFDSSAYKRTVTRTFAVRSISLDVWISTNSDVLMYSIGNTSDLLYA